MANALRRPVRKPPQLLVLPDWPRVEAALRSACRGPLDIVALELERNESFVHGHVLEMVAVVRHPAPHESKRLTLRHVMPGGQPNMREIVGGAEVLGQTIFMRFRGYGGWARAVLSDF